MMLVAQTTWLNAGGEDGGTVTHFEGRATGVRGNQGNQDDPTVWMEPVWNGVGSPGEEPPVDRGAGAAR